MGVEAIAAGVLALPAIGVLGESLLRTPEPSARTPMPAALTAASPPTVPSPLDHVIDNSLVAMPLPSALCVFVAECGINVVASDDDESSVPTMMSGHRASCRDAITTH